MTINEDEDLQARFGELRAQQENDVPGFRSILHREAGRSHNVEGRIRIGARWIPGLAFAAAAAVFLWIAATKDPSVEEERFVDEPSAPDAFVVGHLVVGEWNMPTDALLDLSALPGNDLLNEVPEIGILPIQSPDGAQNESYNRRIPA